MQVFRIVTLPFATAAFSGEGARLYGGRWNPKGWPLVYAAATRSLALLEMLVQDQPLRARYVFIAAALPGNLKVARLSATELSPDWRAHAQGPQLQEIGRGWLARGEAAVLAVPSAVLPQEDNFLLNPRHADFRRIRIGAVEELDLDGRLLRYT